MGKGEYTYNSVPFTLYTAEKISEIYPCHVEFQLYEIYQCLVGFDRNEVDIYAMQNFSKEKLTFTSCASKVGPS